MPIVQAKEEPKPQQKAEPRVDEKLMLPGKYEVTKDSTFKVQLHLKANKEGRWMVMTGAGKDIDSHEVVFRMWTYDEMVELRKMVTTFDATKRMHMIDNDALNRIKVQRLLVSWTLDRDNPRLKLLHVNGVLSDEGWKMFSHLQPNIITHLLEEMNKALEWNG